MGVETKVRANAAPPPSDRDGALDQTNTGTNRSWRLNLASVIIGLIALAGLAIYMYPSTAAWWSQWNQSKLIEVYSAEVNSEVDPGNDALLEDARRYNELIGRGSILLGADANKPTHAGSSEPANLNYSDLLVTPSEIMARLKIPAIDVDLPVYHGTSDEVLAKGVGHLQGTSLPVGGIDSHSVLSAHRGLASATMFNDLDKLVIGDLFTIEVAGEVLTYQVFETQVVKPEDTKTVLPRPGQDIATLVTCTPLGINTHRILVTGERVTPTPIAALNDAGRTPDIPGFPWWAVILPTGALVIGVYIWRSGYPAKPRSSSTGSKIQRK